MELLLSPTVDVTNVHIIDEDLLMVATQQRQTSLNQVEELIYLLHLLQLAWQG